MTTAEQVHKALHYGNGMRKFKSGVAEMEEFNVTSPKILLISNYHSVEFFDDHIKMWRYNDVGTGVKPKYLNIKVEPKPIMTTPYQSIQ